MIHVWLIVFAVALIITSIIVVYMQKSNDDISLCSVYNTCGLCFEFDHKDGWTWSDQSVVDLTTHVLATWKNDKGNLSCVPVACDSCDMNKIPVCPPEVMQRTEELMDDKKIIKTKEFVIKQNLNPVGCVDGNSIWRGFSNACSDKSVPDYSTIDIKNTVSLDLRYSEKLSTKKSE